MIKSFSSVGALSPVGDVVDQIAKRDIGVLVERYIGSEQFQKNQLSGTVADLRIFTGLLERGRLADAMNHLYNKADRIGLDLDNPDVPRAAKQDVYQYLPVHIAESLSEKTKSFATATPKPLSL